MKDVFPANPPLRGDANPNRAPRTPIIAIEKMSFSYDGPLILEDVNLALEERDFISIVGPNGGGKTTLLKLMLGLLSPTKGHIRIFGLPPALARFRIGYVPQHVHLDLQFPVSVIDVVLMGRLGHGRMVGPYPRSDKAIAEKALEELGLADHHRPFSSLSGGQRQRALIARALTSNPDLLLLDEPTANLDVVSERDVYELLRVLNQRLTVILVSHDLDFVSQYVRTLVYVKQTVIARPASDLTAELIRELYQREQTPVHHDPHHPEKG
jgi:zinc transport system ATP-binding protein